MTETKIVSISKIRKIEASRTETDVSLVALAKQSDATWSPEQSITIPAESWQAVVEAVDNG